MSSPRRDRWGTRDSGVITRIFLLRHGEPEAAARGRCYGKLDVGLSPEGRAQVVRAAELLRDVSLAAIYASPRRRTVESAALVRHPGHPAPVLDPDWAEIDFGAFEGLRYEEVERRYPAEFAQWMREPTAVRFPGGESHADLRRRCAAAHERLQARHRHANVLVVTHGGVIRTRIADLLGMPPENLFRLDVSYAALSCVDHYDACPVVRAVNVEA